MNQMPVEVIQPTLIPPEGGTTGALELFPAVWSAAEALVSSQVRLRLEGLAELQRLGAPRLLPLVAYLVTTRLSDPSLELRQKALVLCASLLERDAEGQLAPEGVRQAVIQTVSQMRTRPIYGLLQAVENAPELVGNLARLLNASPYAGRHLMDLLADRKTPLGLRQKAADLIGQVGYLEAAPALERLELRLMARSNGQQSMPFAPADTASEAELLPAVRRALLLLRAA
jgi:hypothetical protein